MHLIHLTSLMETLHIRLCLGLHYFSNREPASNSCYFELHVFSFLGVWNKLMKPSIFAIPSPLLLISSISVSYSLPSSTGAFMLNRGPLLPDLPRSLCEYDNISPRLICQLELP